MTDGNVVRSWETETGRPLLTLRGHVNPIDVFGFTPDGRRLWTLEMNGPLKEWDMRPPGPLAIPFVKVRFAERSNVGFAMSPDGGRVAAVFDIKNGRQFADGVGVWDTSGKSVRNLVLPPWTSGPNSPNLAPAHRLALSRGGRRALLFRADSTMAERTAPPELTIWDVDSGTVVLRQELKRQHLLAVAISPDGRTVASVSRPATDNTPLSVRIFDVDSRREGTPLPVPEGTSIFGLTFSPDGRRLVGLSAFEGQSRGTILGKVIVWDVESGSRLFAADVGSAGQLIGGDESRFAWAPDGSRFACSESSGGTEVTVYDATTGKPIVTMDRPLSGETMVGVAPEYRV